MAERTCAVCGMGGYWVAYDPTTQQDRCVNHVGQDHTDGAGAVGSGVQQAGTASDRPTVAAIEDTDSPSSPPRHPNHENRSTK